MDDATGDFDPENMTEIANEPNFLGAHAGRDGESLHVYVSPVLEWEDDMMAPVRRFLAGRCYLRARREITTLFEIRWAMMW